jgi:pyruvate,water dikinase
MAGIDDIKGLFCFWHPPKPYIPFTILFKKFKSVLERNNRLLELMADMGDKLGGEYVFDRQYIFDVCERISDLVFKLISDLCILTGCDDLELFVAFERIQHEIQEELAGRRAFPMTRTTVLLDELNFELNEEVGNKFAGLGDIRNILDLTTPDGFVITTKAFFDFMECNGLLKDIEKMLDNWNGRDDAYFEGMCREVRNRILLAPIPRNVLSHINAMVDILATRRRGERNEPLMFAVRSSAWGEDSEFSFAGQYESVLNVPRSGILDAYRRVIAGAYTPEAWHYRLHRGYREHEMAMAVGCQLMVQPEVSGAMYTYAPLPDEEEAMVVSAAWGLGPAVVEGIAESDTFFLDRSPPHAVLSMDVTHKSSMMSGKSEGGTVWSDVPELVRDVPCLTSGQLEKLAQAAMVIERYYKRPQDLEWAFDKLENLYILQSRPLNIRPNIPDTRPCVADATRSVQVIFSGKGKVVQRGVGTGKVYLARRGDDLKDFPYGSILVAQYTSPKYSRIMRKANGIITDIGSPAGHMAALAREYRVPTVVDTEVATNVLKTGDEITLDASQNAVYRGIVSELCHFELTEQEVFEESYEYRLLRRLIKKINPLNLLDPHSDEFKPDRCRTYHDITRYVHEKAVEKLIDLSENYQKYHEKSPRRLEFELPLGLMVIDIEGGANAPSGDKSVSIEQIESVPMKAILDGLSKSGMWTTEPIAVDLGSFMSSFTRTFSASLASPEKVGRNLVVISKEYMNLHLRLGYHFNIVDAYIGDAINDNYIYFRFLGGVTDITRRSRRAKFIAGILEQLDFRVEVHGDLVVGRLKKISKERMIDKMKILGGLIGYTRQLDVNMDSDGQIPRYMQDFMQRARTFMEVHNGRYE